MLWNSDLPWDAKEFEFLGLFSGSANASREWSGAYMYMHVKVYCLHAWVDMIHIACMHACKEETCFPCGCLWLVIWQTLWETICYGLPFASWLCAWISDHAWYPKPWSQYMYAILSLRLALFSCLMLAPGCLALMGPDCSSWGAPNLGTTLRSELNNSNGFLPRINVLNGNLTVSRLLVKTHAYMIVHAWMFFGKLCLTFGFWTYI